jgi:hypothetical protein
MSTVMVTSRSILTLVLALSSVVTGAQYSLVKEYAGTHFFDDWDYYGNCEWPMTITLPSDSLSKVNKRS